jgi:hypothetical protein
VEIAEFLRRRTRRILLVALIPLLAGAIALVTARDTQARHVVTVQLEILAPEADSPNAALQAANRLTRIAADDDVSAATARRAGQPLDLVRSSLSAEQEERQVTLTFDGVAAPDVAEDLARLQTEEAVRVLFTPALDEAARTLEDNDQRDLGARQAVSQFEAAHGLSSDPEQYRAVLAPEQVVEYERLLAAVVRSSNGVERAERDFELLESRLNTTLGQVPSFMSAPSAITSSEIIARRVATSVAVGVVLAVALLGLAEVLWPVRPREEEPKATRPEDAIDVLERLTEMIAEPEMEMAGDRDQKASIGDPR